MANQIRPSYVHFSGLQLRYSKSGHVTKDRLDLGHCIADAMEIPSEHAPLINIIIPTSSEECIRVIDMSEGHVLFQFFLTHVVCTAKGTSEVTNRCVLITHLDETLSVQNSPPLEDSKPQTDQPDPNTEPPLSSPKLPKTYVVRCRTTYEASRLLFFMGELLSTRSGKSTNPLSSDYGSVRIRLTTDIQELEDKGGETEWRSVPKTNTGLFKLRSRSKKRFLVGFNQTSGLAEVSFSKCLKISVAYGRFVNESEFIFLGNGENQLIGDAANTLIAGSTYATHVPWPKEDCEYFKMFDEVTGKDGCIFFTVSIHLALSNVDEPICLFRICQARVYKSDELFWLMTDRKPVTQSYSIHLTEFMDADRNLHIGRFLKADKVVPPVPVADSNTTSVTNAINGAGVETAFGVEDTEEAVSEQEEEPLMSGHGEVSREVLDDELLHEWGLLVPAWHAKVREQMHSAAPHLPSSSAQEERLFNGTIGPSLTQLGASLNQHIRRLVNRDVPDALRSEVWQLLTSAVSKESGLLDAYRVLITKPCKFEDVIQRDLARTFPAHAFFRDNVGQDYLFQVSRAYALYDQEVGYCQSLSFFAAVLLLHMPVEQAFTLMVQINNNYGVRELYVNDFAGLHLRLYQLERIIQDQLPDVAKHFSELKLETHMYASQWFLTLFTAKFPLPLVFHIIDLFLTEGMIFIFKVAFSFMRMARRTLLGLDFEGVLKYLRITLPRQFIDSQAGDELMSAAVSAKITPSKLLKYANEWMRMKTQLQNVNSPEQQIKQLQARVNRLEQENEAIASALLSSKASMHQTVDKLEDKAEILTHELYATKQDLSDVLEEKSHLISEIAQVKQMLRTSLEQVNEERKHRKSQIAAHQAITTNLVKRTEANSSMETNSTVQANMFYLRLLYVLLEQLSECDDCRLVLDEHVEKWRQECGSNCPDDSECGNQTGNDMLSPDGLDGLSEVLVESNSTQSSDTTIDRMVLSFDFKKLKPKQWLTSTLNSLKSLKLYDTHAASTSLDTPLEHSNVYS